MHVLRDSSPRTRLKLLIRNDHRAAFTLMELLVAIAIIGILLALLLPAIQSAREAARRVQCQNNLKQLGLAMLNHETLHRRFPSNGWGYLWIGEPDRGTARNQPGGWIYNLLPFLEQEQLHALGSGQPVNQRRAAVARLSETALSMFDCPTRPGAQLSAHNPILAMRNADPVAFVAKTDYAVNEGDYITDTREGPRTLAEGDSARFRWRNLFKATGISYQRSEVRAAWITDGMSNTYMIGEKYVSRPNYHTHDDPGHDQSMYCGVDLDINRWTLEPPRHDADEVNPRLFGSAHSAGCHFLFCDGSVRSITYSINQDLHRHLGNRSDGQVVSPP